MGRNSDAYDRGRSDGQHGSSENIYSPGEDSRQDYAAGFEDGYSDKENDEAND